MRSATLVMTEHCHKKIFNYLFPGDGLEAAAILLCNQGTGKHCCRFIVVDFLFQPHCQSKRKKHFISWPFNDYLTPEKISEIDQQGQSIITIHSHPEGYEQFSETDDKNDRQIFSSVCHWFDDGRSNGSAIMLPDGKIKARMVSSQGKFSPIATVAVVGNDIRIWKSVKQEKQMAYHKKISQTFGKGTLDLLRTIRAGVVGCSGTGSIIIELLLRNCVGELVIVDNDIVEEKNLNRIINSTMESVNKKQQKVLAIKQKIQEIGMQTKVEAIQGLTDAPNVIKSLIDCDVIFGCVDSAYGRYHLDCLGSAYFIPYFDVGVYLEADPKGDITSADAVSHYIHPEGDSLLSRGAYTMDQVTAENWKRKDPKYYQQHHRASYLAEVNEDQPAVMSINMQASCMAFNDFLARIHHYRFDENCEFGSQRFQFVHGHYKSTADGRKPHPLLRKYMGTGDKSLLVRNNINYD